MPPGLPPDPFSNDPIDLTRLFDQQEITYQLDSQEKLAIESDLTDLAIYEGLLKPRGIYGVVLWCDDCQQDHYHDWDMLRAHLMQLLNDGSIQPHEPAYDPQPYKYATWEYCRGYADAALNRSLPEK